MVATSMTTIGIATTIAATLTGAVIATATEAAEEQWAELLLSWPAPAAIGREGYEPLRHAASGGPCAGG